MRRARESDAKTFIVATETGMMHRLRKENPGAEYLAANSKATCGYMKMITPAKLLKSLKEDVYEVDVPRDIADKARLAIERMIAIG